MIVQRPLVLVVGSLLAIAVAALYARLTSAGRREAFAYSNLAFLLDATRVSVWPARIVAGALGIGLLLASIALAGVSMMLPVPARDGTVVLCLDTSGSMRANDIEPSREIAVRAAARAFVRSVPQGTRVGVVAFATTAEQIVQPSDDKDEVMQALDRVPPANGATAIGDALALAGQMLPSRGRRVIVLVTDGVNNHGLDPVEVAQRLGASGVGIYTVGIGTNGSGIAIPGTNEEASIDEDALRTLAAAGHGSYARTVDAPAIARTFRDLARTTVWERRRVDISLALAAASAGTFLITFLGTALAGRFP